MATKRKHHNEDDPKYWEAVHKAQDWDEAGLSHRKIARRLEMEGYTLGRGRGQHAWSDTAVTRALDRHPKHPVEYPVKWPGDDPLGLFDPNSTMEVHTRDRDGSPRTKTIGTAYHPLDFPGETEAEQVAAYEAFKVDVTRRGTLPFDPEETLGEFQERARRQRAYPALKPRDWTVGAEGIEWTDTWLAGGDSWDKEIVPYVINQMQSTAKNALALLDGIQGHAAERGQLRRLYLGLIRRLCMREETVLALKLEIEALKAKLR